MANLQDNGMDDDERQQLLATLAAARELSPDMDKALIDSYLEKRKAAQDAAATSQQAIVPQNGQRQVTAGQWAFGTVFGALIVIAFITALILTHGGLWWLFFPMVFGGFGMIRGFLGIHDPDEQAHMQRRMMRDQLRYQRRMAAMGYYQPSQPGQLPPTGSAPAVPAPGARTAYDVVLQSIGPNKISVIQAVRDLNPGMSLKDAKELVEAAPFPVQSYPTLEAAIAARARLEEAGAWVNVQ